MKNDEKDCDNNDVRAALGFLCFSSNVVIFLGFCMKSHFWRYAPRFGLKKCKFLDNNETLRQHNFLYHKIRIIGHTVLIKIELQWPLWRLTETIPIIFSSQLIILGGITSVGIRTLLSCDHYSVARRKWDTRNSKELYKDARQVDIEMNYEIIKFMTN